jgi:hypothetical protein
MRVFRAAFVGAAFFAATVACQGGRSDLTIEGTITAAATSDSLDSATVTLSYRTISFLDPGVIVTRSDSVGHYRLHGRDVLCEGMGMSVTKTGFLNSAIKIPKCDSPVQIIDFQLAVP